jgi:hypothetical protein
MSGPWLKFYPTDWRADPALRVCSIAARGLWMEMLCVMHEAEPRGTLRVNGKPLTSRQLGALAGCGDVEDLLSELEEAGVFSRNEDGTIFSRRMMRDEARASEDKANGKRGGNPRLKGGVNPPVKGEDKAQKPEAKDTDANASGAVAPSDPRSQLFEEGSKTVQRWTGKSNTAARAFIGKLLKAANDDCVFVLSKIHEAGDMADPVAWVSAAVLPRAAGPPKKVTQANMWRDDAIAAGIIHDPQAASTQVRHDNPRLIRGQVEGPGLTRRFASS